MKLIFKHLDIHWNDTEQFYFIGEFYPSYTNNIFYAYTFSEEAYLKTQVYKQVTKRIGRA